MKKNIIKKLLAASIAALALFALTGCQAPANDNSDSNESTVLKTSYPFVIGSYDNYEPGHNRSKYRTLEITENDKYILTVKDKKETGKVVFSKNYEPDNYEGRSVWEFKLLPETESAYKTSGDKDETIEYYYFWYEGMGFANKILNQDKVELNSFLKCID